MNQLTRRRCLAWSMALAVAGHSEMSGAASGDHDRTACVLGATGHVGGLVVRRFLASGFRVIAVSRSAEKLTLLSARHGAQGRLETLQGDVGSDAQAAQLRTRLTDAFGQPQVVVASLSSPSVDGPMRILDTPTDALRTAFDTNFFTHVTAAKGLIPALPTDGVYLGINGGLANYAGAGMAQLSTTQSAIRSLYEVLALESQDAKRPGAHPTIRLLELYGLVDDGNGKPVPAPMRIDGSALGERIADIVEHPKDNAGPVLTFKSKAFS